VAVPQIMTMRVRLLLLALFCLAGCGTSLTLVSPPNPGDQVGYTSISDSIQSDPAIAALVAPFAEALVDEISEVIGRAEVEITKGRPEGPLGTFAAEAMLKEVQNVSEDPVDMALTNNGGLRTTIGPGPITVGKMYELMPFDNMMIVLDLSAAQVDSLAQQLARNGGDPIAGFSFVVTPDGRATQLRVGGNTVTDDRAYRLVTSDYLANGGGPYTVLWDPTIHREELAFFLRDAFINHLRRIGNVEDRVDGLIRFQQ
jgi:2',3'-cyclic-nucleotide 2'-phosphodiesterase (5'-nucleotidase family)